MKTESTSIKQKRAGGVTLGEARAAARAVRGDRPKGKFVVLTPAKSRELREKYLGTIVPVPARAASSARPKSTKATSGKRVIVRSSKKK